MSKLPIISGQDCVKALGKAGFYLKKHLDRGTLRVIIKQAGLSVEEFLSLL